MAFTLEEIRTRLEAADFSGLTSNYKDIEAAPSYPIIIDYLTGQSKAISGIQQHYSLSEWRTIKNLINLEEPNPRDQLVLDVIYHPEMWSWQKIAFYRWLAHHLLKTPTDKMFETVLHLLKQRITTDEEIFDFLVCRLGEVEKHINVIENTDIKSFLIKQVKGQPEFVFPSHGDRFWNHFYFELLEESNINYAATYALYGMFAHVNNPATFFATYKDGGYMGEITPFLASGKSPTPETFQSKFASVIRLYEFDPEKFKDLALTVSQQYLGFYIAQGFPDFDHPFESKQFTDPKLNNLEYSGLAIHFLLKYNRPLAEQFLNKWIEQKKYFGSEKLKVISHHLQNDAYKYIEHSFKLFDGYNAVNNAMEAINLLKSNVDPELSMPFIWSQVNHKSKQVREVVGRVLAEKDAGAEAKAIALLENKNSDIRITAAKILSYISTPSAREAVATVVNKEANDNVRDILLPIVAAAYPKNADEQFINNMVEAAAKRGKLNKPVEDWLEESALSPVFYTNGQQVPTNSIRFLLYRMSRTKEISSDIEARYIISSIDKEKAAPFALELIKLFIDKNGKPEHKYLMVLAALLGNDEIVDKIRLSINKWIDDSRWKMAEYGVGALALQGSDKALRWVEWYSRKYKNKKANVGAAALAALENAAEELGITAHELGDRIVPDFGFDGLFKHFTVDGEEYRAFIDQNFKIAFFNDDNKKLKAVPANAGSELKEEFKGIAKEVRDIVKSQSPRLEYYLIIQRRWPFIKWQQFFLQNPIMFIYATKLLWGVYDDEGKLLQTFLCNEDTSLQDITQEEISPDETKSVGIVHPSQLNADQLQQWKQLFFDNSIEPIFPQLDRKVPGMQGINLSVKIITKYEGKQMKEGSTRSTLERYGWRRGGVGDAGSLLSFNLFYPEKKLEAVLEVEGISVVYGYGAEEKLGKLYIRDINKESRAYYRQETDNDLVTFNSVPGIFIQEMLAAIESIAPFEKTV